MSASADNYEGGDGIGSGCYICGCDNDHGKLLLCELCNGEYHTYCLSPPLNYVPENEWYCDRCKRSDDLELMVAALPESYTSRFGEICWAQGGVGYGWWPACIYDPRLTVGAARIQAIKHLGKRHLVYFFECAEAPFEILPDSKIMLWEQGIFEDCHLGKTAKASTKARFAVFRCAMHAASIEESKPKEFRLDWNHQGGSAFLPSPSSSSPVRSVREEKKQKGKRMVPVPFDVQKSESKIGRSGNLASSADIKTASLPDGTNKKRPRDSLVSAKTDSLPKSNSVSLPLVQGDADGELFCTVLRHRGETEGKTNVGFVQILSRQKATFADLRQVIQNELVPDAIPSGWEWRFLLPTLGPVSIKQETKFGPLLSMLLKTSNGADVGDGSLQSPIQVLIAEKKNET